MTIKSFFKLVEIQTKVASIIPFLLGTLYTIYHFNLFNLNHFLIMLLSLLSFDMTTTAINNYFDYKKAHKKQGYGYESHNAIVRDQLKESTVIITIFALLFIALFFGILLVINTNYIVLILGAVSFLIGILYSFGPIPISRTPLGELFSGATMGLLIPFIASYIHIYNHDILNIALNNTILSIQFNFVELLSILLISIPVAVGISNIMLANNICDIEDDKENRRYTLPIYIGKNRALQVFKYLYYAGYLAIMVGIILEILPIISILTLLTFLIVKKNINRFNDLQSKEKTFILSVQNFVIMNSSLLLTLFIGIIF